MLTKEQIATQLNPFLDKLTPQELAVFKKMVQKLKDSIPEDSVSVEANTN